jgi:hypothetical protein
MIMGRLALIFFRLEVFTNVIIDLDGDTSSENKFINQSTQLS